MHSDVFLKLHALVFHGAEHREGFASIERMVRGTKKSFSFNVAIQFELFV